MRAKQAGRRAFWQKSHFCQRCQISKQVNGCAARRKRFIIVIQAIVRSTPQPRSQTEAVREENPFQSRLCWPMTPGSVERSCSPVIMQNRMQGYAHEVGLTCFATRSPGQSRSMRTRLMVIAVTTCCTSVLCGPSARTRRMPIPRTAEESVPQVSAHIPCACRRAYKA